jgi:hypothetical protein
LQGLQGANSLPHPPTSLCGRENLGEAAGRCRANGHRARWCWPAAAAGGSAAATAAAACPACAAPVRCCVHCMAGQPLRVCVEGVLQAGGAGCFYTTALGRGRCRQLAVSVALWDPMAAGRVKNVGRCSRCADCLHGPVYEQEPIERLHRSIILAAAQATLHIITMSTEEPIVEPPAAAAEPEAQGDGAEASEPAAPAPRKLPPGVRIPRPVRPVDDEIKAQVDALQQSSE